VADHTAIAEVGHTLVELLEDRMDGLLARDDVALASPAAQGTGGNDWRLTLYLYDVSESGHLPEGDQRETDPERGMAADAPLVLDLQYLLTAHPTDGGADGTKKTKEQHEVLGRAMQVFRDNAILRGSDLRDSLAGEDSIRVSIERESLDAVMDIWNTFPDQRYEPSVAYRVTPVPLDSRRETPVRQVVERTVENRSLSSEAPE
jgi:hypothetical protein